MLVGQVYASIIGDEASRCRMRDAHGLRATGLNIFSVYCDLWRSHVWRPAVDFLCHVCGHGADRACVAEAGLEVVGRSYLYSTTIDTYVVGLCLLLSLFISLLGQTSWSIPASILSYPLTGSSHKLASSLRGLYILISKDLPRESSISWSTYPVHGSRACCTAWFYPR
jgi:hypothetical protein